MIKQTKAVKCSCLWKTCFPVHSNWPDFTDLHPQLCNYLNIKKPLLVLGREGCQIMKTEEEWTLQALGFLGLSHFICSGFICCFLLSLHCGLESFLRPKEPDLPSSTGWKMIWISKVTFERVIEGSLGKATQCGSSFAVIVSGVDLTQYTTKAI